jgi:hypothetical protein
MRLITRDEAKGCGMYRYYTGKPCIHGHDSPRYVSDGSCIECSEQRRPGYRPPSPITMMAVPNQLVPFMRSIMESALDVPEELRDRCTQDAELNLYIDDRFDEQFESLEELERAKWDWLIQEHAEWICSHGT